MLRFFRKKPEKEIVIDTNNINDTYFPLWKILIQTIEPKYFLQYALALLLVSKSEYHFFKNDVTFIAEKFRYLLARGNEDALPLLKTNPEIIFQKGYLKDYSGREFNNISGFEYLLYAWDSYMLLSCLSVLADSEQKILNPNNSLNIIKTFNDYLSKIPNKMLEKIQAQKDSCLIRYDLSALQSVYIKHLDLARNVNGRLDENTKINLLITLQEIGILQSELPVNFVQAFLQLNQLGFHGAANETCFHLQNLPRDLKFKKYPSGISWYPLRNEGEPSLQNGDFFFQILSENGLRALPTNPGNISYQQLTKDLVALQEIYFARKSDFHDFENCLKTILEPTKDFPQSKRF